MRDRNGKAFFGASLLLAEDDPLNADIASRTLLKMGCRVTTAPTACLPCALGKRANSISS